MRSPAFYSRAYLTAIGLVLMFSTACGQAAQTSAPTAAVTIPVATATAPATASATLVPNVATPRSVLGQLTLVWHCEYYGMVELGNPSDVVFDADGYSYVSAPAAKSVIKFDPTGKFVTSWGEYGQGEGQFSLSTGIAVDGQGNIYVGDFYNKRIQKFDPNGKFLLQWATEPPVGPASVGLDPQGNIYVDNFIIHEHYVQKFDPTGKLLLQWGSTGSEDGQFGAGGASGPEDLAMDKEGNVYVADRLNDRIQKFDSNGKFLAKFGAGTSKKGHGSFFAPTGIAVDSAGYLYVLDTNFLQKIAPDGTFIAQWSTDGGDLDRGGIVAVDDQANLYILAHAQVDTAGGKTDAVLLKKFQQ